MSSAAKNQQRQLAYAARNAQTDRVAISNAICSKIIQQPEYQQAKTIVWYLHCRSEVNTQIAVQEALTSDKRIVIPYCTKDADGQNCLGFWLLENFAELVAGTWGILEPPKERWLDADKRIDESELDLVIVPGVAFDRLGGRLGNGAGYYDRMLALVKPEAILIGVCFESQLCSEITMQAHDIMMNKIITETTIYTGKGRL